MPDLKFTFAVNGRNPVTYRVPPKSFLYSDVDYRTNLTTCHLGIIGQKYNDMDYWTLGGAFMENFYVTYDAADPQQLRVGLSSNVAEEERQKFGEAFTVWLAVILGAALVAVFAILILCICVRRRREQRLNKAKTYFESLEKQDDPEAEFLEQHNQAQSEAKASKKSKGKKNKEEDNSNPNMFVSTAAFDEDDTDEVSSAEARDLVPDKQTSNEQALGDLI